MDPITKAILSSWHWRPEVITVLGGLGLLYSAGWWQLRQRTKSKALKRYGQSAAWRLVSFLAGLTIIGISLLSPIEVLVQHLFFMHMIQHLLMIMIAPPLLLVANPFPVILWGLPSPIRQQVGAVMSRLLNRESTFRQHLRSATGAGVVWLLWVVCLLGWHDPNAYNAALESSFVHDVEHLTFFIASMLFWWRVVGAGPRIHKQASPVGRAVTLMGAVPLNMFLGIALFFTRNPVYTYYIGVPRLWGIDALSDQQIGGFIMWVPGSMMYILGAIFMIGKFVGNEDKKPVLPESRWGNDEAVAAPGFKKATKVS